LDLEGAESLANAQTAHGYIRKAADASFLVAEAFNGQVLEIHGRTLHLGLQYSSAAEVESILKGAAGLLHVLLKRAYGSGGPSGWRMAADHDTTLTITSVGIHNDTSLVSLSPAANYPAKQLGKKAVSLWQLGAKIHGNWQCEDLDSIAETYGSLRLAGSYDLGKNLLEEVMMKRARAVNLESLSSVRQVNCQAAPLGSPTSKDFYSCYGYVLSMDLDGFTKRVAEVANGTPDEQRQLAEDFYEIMEKAAKFAQDHPEWFIQFPFAGDNAIFAVTAEYLSDFSALKKVKPVSIAVEWEEEMGDLRLPVDNLLHVIDKRWVFPCILPGREECREMLGPGEPVGSDRPKGKMQGLSCEFRRRARPDQLIEVFAAQLLRQRVGFHVGSVCYFTRNIVPAEVKKPLAALPQIPDISRNRHPGNFLCKCLGAGDSGPVRICRPIQMNQNKQVHRHVAALASLPNPARNQHPLRSETARMASNASARRAAGSFVTMANRRRLKDRIASGARRADRYCRASAGRFRSRNICVTYALVKPSSRAS